MDELYQQLRNSGRVKVNELLSKHSTFKIGGPAKYFVKVKETKKLVGLLNYLSGEGIEYFILGGGSNVLFPDEFDGVIIKIKNEELRMKNKEIVADAGVELGQVVNLAAQNELTGMEWGVGIPGTIGGAVRGNAGAYGSDTSASIDKVEIWRNGEVITLNKEECQFGYRNSLFKQESNNDVVLRAYFKLSKGDKTEIMKKMQEYGLQRGCRISTNPTCGCFFKNMPIEKYTGDKSILPEKFLKFGKVSAGWLIEQANCQGLAEEHAKISANHNNIIENTGHATQKDILDLVAEIKDKVYNKFGVELEEEVEIVS